MTRADERLHAGDRFVVRSPRSRARGDGRCARVWRGALLIVSALPLAHCDIDTACQETASCPITDEDDASDDAVATPSPSDALGSDDAETLTNVVRRAIVDAADTAPRADASSAPADAHSEAAIDASAGTADARLDTAYQEALPRCDGTKTPSEDSCVIDLTYGVFVSPQGNDDVGRGTESAPYKTLGRALTVAQGKRVYACATAGDYDEKVTITNGASVFGGFDCSGPKWSYLTTRSAQLRPTTPGAVLTISGAPRVELENVALQGRDATEPGGSSVAVWANGAANVVLRRATLAAASGRAGAEVTTTPNYTGASAPNGSTTTSSAGAAEQSCLSVCANGVHSTGGRGGDGALVAPAQPGAAGRPAISPTSPPGATGGAGEGKRVDNLSCSNGLPGSNAPPAAAGAGAARWGSLSINAWTAASAIPGSVGGPGQGGGGGGGAVIPLVGRGGGGGGACGGCGGGGGPAGNSGGSSFALLSYMSAVTLEACVLTAGSAGNGSKGADGQLGQAGGYPGVADAACIGGQGGQGGQGGGGGGGAGGLSVAIAYVGAMPSLTSSTIRSFAALPALGGAAGVGGTPPASQGKAGVAQAQLDLSL